MLRDLVGLSVPSAQDALSLLSAIGGRGHVEERALLSIAAIGDAAQSIVDSGDKDKTESVVNAMMVMYNEAANVAMRCCVLTSLTSLAVAAAEGTPAMWMEELVALLQTTVTTSLHRHMKQSVAPCDGLNATAVLCLAELSHNVPGLFGPNLAAGQSTTAALRASLRGSNKPYSTGSSGQSSKPQSGSLAAVRAALDSDCAMNAIHGDGAMYDCPARAVAFHALGAKRALKASADGDKGSAAERDRLITTRDTLREAAALSALLPRLMLPSLVHSLGVVWNYDQIGIDSVEKHLARSIYTCSAPSSGGNKAAAALSSSSTAALAVSSSAAVRWCREAVDSAKRMTLQPPSFVPAVTAQQAAGAGHLEFRDGPEGLGMYRSNRDALAPAHPDVGDALLDLPLLCASERAVLAHCRLFHGIPLSSLAGSLGPHLRFDTPFIFCRRVRAALRHQQGQHHQLFQTLRSVREKGWYSPAIRTSLALTLAELALAERQAVPLVANLLCGCSPDVVLQVLNAVLERQLGTAAVDKHLSLSHRAMPAATLPASDASEAPRGSSASSSSTQKRVSGVLMVPDFHQPAEGGSSTVEASGHKETAVEFLQPHASLVWHVCSSILVNGTATQVSNFFPVLVMGFECKAVPNKLVLLEHLMARIPELSNTWSVGQWLLAMVRHMLTSEVQLLEQSATLGLSSGVFAFLSAMISHFSDCAISQHCTIVQNLLSHVPLYTAAALLSVSDDDAEDVLAMCSRRTQNTAAAMPPAARVRVTRIAVPAAPGNCIALSVMVEAEEPRDSSGEPEILAGTVELYADANRHFLVSSWPVVGTPATGGSPHVFSTMVEVHESRDYAFFATFRGPLEAQHISRPLLVPFADLLRLPAAIACSTHDQSSAGRSSWHSSLCTLPLSQLLAKLQVDAEELAKQGSRGVGATLRVTAVPSTELEVSILEEEEGSLDSVVVVFRAATWQCMSLFEQWVVNT
jgi:hypothetical protein